MPAASETLQLVARLAFAWNRPRGSAERPAGRTPGPGRPVVMTPGRMAYRVLLSDSLGPEGLARLREQPDLEIDARARPAARRADGDHRRVRRPRRPQRHQGDRRRDRAGRPAARHRPRRHRRRQRRRRRGHQARHRGDEHARRQQRHHRRARHRHAARAGAQHPAGRRGRARGQVARSKCIGTEVCNKVLGIVGLGNIGTHRRRARRRAAHEGDRATIPSSRRRPRRACASSWCRSSRLFARADFITIHTPLTAETRGLIGRERSRA